MAINFPATSGEATDGSFTHTESGITWSWDGTTWTSLGVTGSYSLPIASSSTLGGIKIGSNLTISGDGTLAAQTGASVNCFSTIQVSGQNNVVADSNSDTLTLAAGTNVTLATNNSSDTITINAAGGALTIQEEGVDLATDATTLNFVGAGVTASGTGATKTITISGGGGGSSTPADDDIQVVYTVTGSGVYNFTGNGVDSSVNYPTIYMYRDTKYRFIHNAGSACLLYTSPSPRDA